MNTTSLLVRENIQRLSDGRIASDVEIDGETVRVIASLRRKKTISALFQDGILQLSVPMHISDAQIVDSARNMLAKISARDSAGARVASDPELYERAVHLARVWLNGEVHPNSVVWSDRQQRSWGTCTIITKVIRLSTRLRDMPQWVIDGVLVHELAHLKYAGHGQDFKDFTRRYPRMAEADAFLLGITHRQRYGSQQVFPEAYD